MKKIVVYIQPFTIDQTVAMFDDGKFVGSYNLKLTNLNETLPSFISHYNIDEVDFVGNYEYCSKYEKALKTKYAGTNLIITIMER